MLLNQSKFSKSTACHKTLGDRNKFSVSIDDRGQVLCITAGDVLISRSSGDPLDGGLAHLFLRVHDGDTIKLHALLGVNCKLTSFGCEEHIAQWEGTVAGCTILLSLFVDALTQMLFWDVIIENDSSAAIVVDTVWFQDIGLASRDALLSNEAYTAHYVDEAVMQDPTFGPVLTYRQNLKQADQHPWLIAACLTGAESYATDAFDVFGNAYRCGNEPSGLLNKRLVNRCYQYEFSCATLQSRPIKLALGDSTRARFALAYMPDHSTASSDADLAEIGRMCWVAADRLNEIIKLDLSPLPNHLLPSHKVHGRDLCRTELQEMYPHQWRHVESTEQGVLSFFYDLESHIVTRAKETLVERPHGSILVGNADTDSMSEVLATTVYMTGVFSAQIVYGNTSFHKINSLPREPLGLSRAAGMRLYFEVNKSWKLLGTPSIFEMQRDACTWLYVLEDEVIKVRVALDGDRDVINFHASTTGPARRFLVTNELVMGPNEADLNACLDVSDFERWLTVADLSLGEQRERGINLSFGMSWSEATDMRNVGGSELIGGLRGDPVLVFQTEATKQIDLSLAASHKGTTDVLAKLNSASLVPCPDLWNDFNRGFDCSGQSDVVARLNDTLRWYAHNALIHYASPHGLEQYSGAAWGTRDACQGPLEYFIALQHHNLARSVLLKTFAAQYADNGDWPQWFMHDEYADIMQFHSHGDIVVWPLKALALYLDATGDTGILEVVVPYVMNTNASSFEQGTIADHINKALNRIEHEFIPETALIRYGGGDWDDSLQPVNTDLAMRLVSGWTQALLAQSLQELDAVLPPSGLKERIAVLSARVRADFRRHVLIDGQVAGFLLYDEDYKTAEPLLHPKDQRTGIQNRLIPMTRSIIAGLLTREEADHQMQCIASHLKYPDGVRLMDQPAPYSGGIETFFKRAESAANFGREIGLQYVHAHIRYSEALAMLGDGEGLLQALMKISPVGIQKSVPNADLRQSNMYFSSSDGAFLNRADAAKNFTKLKDGSIQVKGGWRLYSSGPGIYSGIVIRHLFGLRECKDAWVFDPVLPAEMDGTVLHWELCGKAIEIEYRVGDLQVGVESISVGEHSLPALRQDNPYRMGGLIVDKAQLLSAITKNRRITICYNTLA
jgi:cellobiose phosphorylase